MIKLILFFVFTSCSFLVNTFEKDTLAEKEITPVDKIDQTYCPIIQNKILINESKNSQRLFEKFLDKISSRYVLSFIDKSVLWSFVQMNLRPDLNSPRAKLQILLKQDNEEHYFNILTKEKMSMPYFYLLSEVLKKFKSKYKLAQLAAIYQTHFPQGLLVTNEFEDFLSSHKDVITNDDILAKYYLRGDETLRKNERLPKIEIAKYLNKNIQNLNPKFYEIKRFLFNFKDQGSFVPKCNFDMSLYENSIFLISKSKIQSSIFGYKEGKNSFLAISSQGNEKIKSLDSTLFFDGTADVRSAAICMYTNRLKKDNFLWMISTQSRDPGQHLYHLLEYGLAEVNNLKDLDSMLKFSRHLFLKNPVRLVFESKRSDQDQILELLKLDIPLYSAKSLGKIWSYFHNPEEASFLLDTRRRGAISCKSQ